MFVRVIYAWEVVFCGLIRTVCGAVQSVNNKRSWWWWCVDHIFSVNLCYRVCVVILM